MSNFFSSWMSKKAVAPYVDAIKMSSEPGSVLTTIIEPALLGGYYVRTAIDASSEDIERTMARSNYWSKHTTISTETIPGG